MSAVAEAVDARAVVRRYRGGRGVGPVDLCVAAGEVVVLMGPNGAGKTTLLRLLATLGRPDAGLVRWFGGVGEVQARRGLGLSLDAAVEEETLSGLQAAHFWCRQWVRDPGRALALCEEALQRFGLWEVRDEPVGAYSFGMRRRLALVEALAHEPALALLDEPTAGLDPAGVEALVRELRRRSSMGKATVVASNDANFGAAAAHRVAFLVGGRMVRCGAPPELLAAVGAARVAELSLASAVDVAGLRGIAGVESVAVDGGDVVVRYRDASALPRIVAAADHPGGRLRALSVHEPDLGDAFRELTGAALHAEER